MKLKIKRQDTSNPSYQNTIGSIEKTNNSKKGVKHIIRRTKKDHEFSNDKLILIDAPKEEKREKSYNKFNKNNSKSESPIFALDEEKKYRSFFNFRKKDKNYDFSEYSQEKNCKYSPDNYLYTKIKSNTNYPDKRSFIIKKTNFKNFLKSMNKIEKNDDKRNFKSEKSTNSSNHITQTQYTREISNISLVKNIFSDKNSKKVEIEYFSNKLTPDQTDTLSKTSNKKEIPINEFSVNSKSEINPKNENNIRENSIKCDLTNHQTNQNTLFSSLKKYNRYTMNKSLDSGLLNHINSKDSIKNKDKHRDNYSITTNIDETRDAIEGESLEKDNKDVDNESGCEKLKFNLIYSRNQIKTENNPEKIHMNNKRNFKNCNCPECQIYQQISEKRKFKIFDQKRNKSDIIVASNNFLDSSQYFYVKKQKCNKFNSEINIEKVTKDRISKDFKMDNNLVSNEKYSNIYDNGGNIQDSIINLHQEKVKIKHEKERKIRIASPITTKKKDLFSHLNSSLTIVPSQFPLDRFDNPEKSGKIQIDSMNSVKNIDLNSKSVNENIHERESLACHGEIDVINSLPLNKKLCQSIPLINIEKSTETSSLNSNILNSNHKNFILDENLIKNESYKNENSKIEENILSNIDETLACDNVMETKVDEETEKSVEKSKIDTDIIVNSNEGMNESKNDIEVKFDSKRIHSKQNIEQYHDLDDIIESKTSYNIKNEFKNIRTDNNSPTVKKNISKFEFPIDYNIINQTNKINVENGIINKPQEKLTRKNFEYYKRKIDQNKIYSENIHERNILHQLEYSAEEKVESENFKLKSRREPNLLLKGNVSPNESKIYKEMTLNDHIKCVKDENLRINHENINNKHDNINQVIFEQDSNFGKRKCSSNDIKSYISKIEDPMCQKSNTLNESSSFFPSFQNSNPFDASKFGNPIERFYYPNQQNNKYSSDMPIQYIDHSITNSPNENSLSIPYNQSKNAQYEIFNYRLSNEINNISNNFVDNIYYSNENNSCVIDNFENFCTYEEIDNTLIVNNVYNENYNFKNDINQDSFIRNKFNPYSPIKYDASHSKFLDRNKKSYFPYHAKKNDVGFSNVQYNVKKSKASNAVKTSCKDATIMNDYDGIVSQRIDHSKQYRAKKSKASNIRNFVGWENINHTNSSHYRVRKIDSNDEICQKVSYNDLIFDVSDFVANNNRRYAVIKKIKENSVNSFLQVGRGHQMFIDSMTQNKLDPISVSTTDCNRSSSLRFSSNSMSMSNNNPIAKLLRNKSKMTKSAEIRIGKCTESLKMLQVYRNFAKFGAITDITLNKNNEGNYCSIKMKDVSDAMRAYLYYQTHMKDVESWIADDHINSTLTLSIL